MQVRAPLEAHAPAFSPDGRQLAYVTCEQVDQEGDAEYAERSSHGCNVMLLDVDETYVPRGATRRLTTSAMGGVGAIAWSRDGRVIVFSAEGNLWRVSLDGERGPERIEVAGLSAGRATMSTRDRLVFSRSEEDLDVCRLARGGASENLVVSTAFDAHAQFSPDGGRIAFVSSRTDTLEVWVANVDGTSQRQLTRGPTASQGSPRWSPDGSTIAFDAQEANGDRHIWTIPVDGGAPRQLTTIPGEQSAPTWSHDGRWIYFSHGGRDRLDIWRVPAAGGRPEQISSSGSGVMAFESADAEHIVYKLRKTDSPLVEASLSGGSPSALLACVGSDWGFSVQGDSVYYVPCGTTRAGDVHVLDRRTGSDGLWGVVPGAGSWRGRGALESAFLWDLPISPDGRSILFNRIKYRANLWLLENFR